MARVAGYSGTPLVRKLGIKDDHVVLLDGAPTGFELATDGQSVGGAHVVRRLPRTMDVTLTFHTSYAALAQRLPTLFGRTSTAGMVWVCWPKKSAQKALGLTSDLDENKVRDLGLRLGFVDIKVAAVDDTWSGLKFVRRLVDRV